MKYDTNKQTRFRIDNLLHRMHMIIASQDTNAKLDYGAKTKKEVAIIGLKIKELDPDFYDIICPYGYIDT
jgi:hypothetical protein